MSSSPGLPDVDAYRLPAADELPASRAAWEPVAGRLALLIHDLQKYFVRIYPDDRPPMPELLANVGALRDRCDALGVPVFYSAQPGAQDPLDRGLQSDLWGPGMGDDPRQCAIVDELRPRPDHLAITKLRYSAFQRTPLAEMLAARGRDQLLVTGVYAGIGCLLTAAEAFMRDVRPFVVADAVADFDRQRHDTALEYVARHCGRVLTTDQLLELL